MTGSFETWVADMPANGDRTRRQPPPAAGRGVPCVRNASGRFTVGIEPTRPVDVEDDRAVAVGGDVLGRRCSHLDVLADRRREADVGVGRLASQPSRCGSSASPAAVTAASFATSSRRRTSNSDRATSCGSSLRANVLPPTTRKRTRWRDGPTGKSRNVRLLFRPGRQWQVPRELEELGAAVSESKERESAGRERLGQSFLRR